MKKSYLISANLNNKNLIYEKKDIKKLFSNNFLGAKINRIHFSSENLIEFNIDKRLRFKNLKVDSKIDIKEISLINNTNLSEFFPKLENEMNFSNHKIDLIYDNKHLKINGEGKFFQNSDDIKYEIEKNEKNVKFKTSLEIIKNSFKLNFLNYEKKDQSNLKIIVNGKIDQTNNVFFEKIYLVEDNNKFNVQNLFLSNNYRIKKFKKIDLDYKDNDKIVNKISVIKKDNLYSISGDVFNANRLIKNLLDSSSKKENFFKEKTEIKIKIKKTYLDKLNLLNDLKGHLVFEDGDVLEANLNGEFLNKDKIIFTIKTNANDKITTLFSEKAKPIVDRYKFIKGFDEGILDFYSIKKNNVSNSTLKIYNFKLKELPTLTKILTLASLQGIADILSGEGIRFNEFEMNFSNSDKLMTIDEIYAIGPAISILMSGYLEFDKLVSLRGTLVPATTLNKTIGSIPILGDILVGKKMGEGVFGVSFKIKGPPDKLETSVNPIKTLTPRFITRTLEKIKKSN